MRDATIALLAALLLIPFSFCTSYGQSLVRVERVWTINGSGNYSFDGALAMNNSDHRVLEITTTPAMAVVIAPDGSIRVGYNGSADILQATAIVAVNFSTSIQSDSPLERRNLSATNLTAWTPGIEAAAESLADNSSSLNTIRNLTNFVHDYITYNISYFGAVVPAEQVFVERQGVCVEYSHLLISMARRLGFETRFVSGYVNGGLWQPHAWVEITVPGYDRPLQVDPTFDEIGELDSSHVAMGSGADQGDIYDRIESTKKMDISVTDNVEFINESADAKDLAIAYTFNESTGLLEMILGNDRQEYAYATYELLLPEALGLNERKAVLLGPQEMMRLNYTLNISDFEPGYRYTIPMAASIGDSKLSTALTVEPEAPPQPQQPGATPAGACAPAFAILALLINLYLSRQ